MYIRKKYEEINVNGTADREVLPIRSVIRFATLVPK